MEDRDPHVDSQTGTGHYQPGDVVRLSARVRDDSLRDDLLNVNFLNPSTLSVTFEFLDSNNSSLGELTAETKLAKNSLLDYDDYELVQRVSAGSEYLPEGTTIVRCILRHTLASGPLNQNPSPVLQDYSDRGGGIGNGTVTVADDPVHARRLIDTRHFGLFPSSDAASEWAVDVSISPSSGQQSEWRTLTVTVERLDEDLADGLSGLSLTLPEDEVWVDYGGIRKWVAGSDGLFEEYTTTLEEAEYERQRIDNRLASFIASLIPLVGETKSAVNFFFGLNITEVHSAEENELNCLEEVRVITLVPTGDRRLQVEIPVHSLTDADYASLKVMPVVGQDPTLATIPDLIRSSGSDARARPSCDAPPAPGATPGPSPTPTATPEAPADECVKVVSDSGAITGSWSSDCASEGRSGSYASYYTFTLTESAEATITAESSVDTYLFLREGSGRDGAELCNNDDYGSAVSGDLCQSIDSTLESEFDSGLVASLGAGTYTIEVTTYTAGETGTFTLTVERLGPSAQVLSSFPAAKGTVVPTTVADSRTDTVTSEQLRILQAQSLGFSFVSAGVIHVCALRNDGSIVCWGGNDYGQSDAPSGSFSSVSAGPLHNCGVRTDGTVACWGYNRKGQSDAPSGSFFSVSAGYGHTCGVRIDGLVVCWGDNEDGQSDAPSGSFSSVSAGSGAFRSHTCGVKTDGTVDCWGNNSSGQSDAPVGSFSSVSAGRVHTCGVRTDGTIACWGDNFRGQSRAPGGAFSSVNAGDYHTCGVRTDGTVDCWGYNKSGQSDAPDGSFSSVSAGSGHFSSHTCGVRTDGSIACWGNTPGGSFSSVSAGGGNTCGVRTDNSVACWGYNNNGQSDAPTGSFSSVSAGGGYACGVRTDGGIACWGFNYFGQSDAPTDSFSSVSTGASHACGVRTDGSLVCWGDNRYGQSDAPTGSFSSVSTGGYSFAAHTCGVRTGGTIECWGSNNHGQTDAPSSSFSSVSAGSSHTCGLNTDGSLSCWGGNDYGQSDEPDGSFSSVSAGSAFTCGLRADSSISCWGYNDDGRSEAPSGSFSSVSAGGGYACGVRMDNSVACWGRYKYDEPNSPGQTDATPTPTPTPELPSPGTPELEARLHSCGVEDRDPHVDRQTGIGYYSPDDDVRLSARVRDDSLRDNLLNVNQLNPSILSVTFEFLDSDNSSLGELTTETKLVKNTLLTYDDYELVQRVRAGSAQLPEGTTTVRCILRHTPASGTLSPNPSPVLQDDSDRDGGIGNGTVTVADGSVHARRLIDTRHDALFRNSKDISDWAVDVSISPSSGQQSEWRTLTVTVERLDEDISDGLSGLSLTLPEDEVWVDYGGIRKWVAGPDGLFEEYTPTLEEEEYERQRIDNRLASFIASLIPLVGETKSAVNFLVGLNITEVHSAGENDLNCLEEVRVMTLVPTGDRRLQVEIPVYSLTDADYASLKVMPVVGRDPSLTTIPDLIRPSDSVVRARPACDAPPTPQPTVTPTPSPSPEPVTSCVETVAGSDTINRSWTTGCASSVPDRNGAYARFFTFTLSESVDVTVTLESSVDTYLYLYKGTHGDGMTLLCESDDYEGQVVGQSCDKIAFALDSELDSGLVASLDAGDYTIEATTYEAEDTVGFTLTVDQTR